MDFGAGMDERSGAELSDEVCSRFIALEMQEARKESVVIEDIGGLNSALVVYLRVYLNHSVFTGLIVCVYMDAFLDD